jgi:uncharacterized protein (DUF1810 family)
MSSAASYDLDRFVRAQDPVFAQVLSQLKNGRKTSHWMWFVFPQIAGLGMSAMSQKYAIASLEEARAYLAHSQLGSRLRQCVEALLCVPDRTAHEIFGSPDDLKLHSSLTLFAHAALDDDALFRAALKRFFAGAEDQATLERI